MAEGARTGPSERCPNLPLNLTSKPSEIPEKPDSNERIFSPDSARRQRLFTEPSKFAAVVGQVSGPKKHDVYQTLQETLEVLNDEAVVSRDSHKKEGLWCHPFEIPRHPIEQIELKNEEIELQRQHSNLINSRTPNNITEIEQVMKKEKEDPVVQSDERCTFYQKLSISGGDISGVCLFWCFNVVSVKSNTSLVSL